MACVEVVVDLKGCTSLDSTFVGTLVGLAQRARAAGAPALRLNNLSKACIKNLQQMHLEQLRVRDARAARLAGPRPALPCYNRVMPPTSLQPDLHRVVWDQLRLIDDPEMPISIVDLGLVLDVEITGCAVRVKLTPTYTGCVALDLIDRQIISALQALPGVQQVSLLHVFDPPWTPDRISQTGRDRLRTHGVTVADRRFIQVNINGAPPTPCPFCSSTRTRVDSPFGPTRCRMIYYCDACHNTFEHIKAV